MSCLIVHEVFDWHSGSNCPRVFQRSVFQLIPMHIKEYIRSSMHCVNDFIWDVIFMTQSWHVFVWYPKWFSCDLTYKPAAHQRGVGRSDRVWLLSPEVWKVIRPFYTCKTGAGLSSLSRHNHMDVIFSTKALRKGLLLYTWIQRNGMHQLYVIWLCTVYLQLHFTCRCSSTTFPL